MKQTYEPKIPIATDIFLPNHSGDHSAGRVLRAPTNDFDIVNKKYVGDDHPHQDVNTTASPSFIKVIFNDDDSTPGYIASDGSEGLVIVSSAGDIGIATNAGDINIGSVSGTINTTSIDVTGRISSTTSTFSTTGPTDNVDVSGVNILFIDSTSNAVTIGGFAGGVAGQVLHIAKQTASANAVTLEHAEAEATQPIYLHAGADEALTSEYGGWTLVCDGTHWHDCSHSKHV